MRIFKCFCYPLVTAEITIKRSGRSCDPSGRYDQRRCWELRPEWVIRPGATVGVVTKVDVMSKFGGGSCGQSGRYDQRLYRFISSVRRWVLRPQWT